MSEFYLKNKDEIVAKIVFGDGDQIKELEILSSQMLQKKKKK